MAIIDEVFLESMGIEVIGGNEREMRAFCPVHHLVKGREASSPKWYMNRETGAWICFSCNQSGSLQHLVNVMGGDVEVLETIQIDVLKRRLAQDEEDAVVAPPKPVIYISDYAFSKNPLPPQVMLEARDLSPAACEQYNLRWSKEGKCFLVPLYTIDGGQLIGWQEKSRGYFNNVPESVSKSVCLFGYQQYEPGVDMIVVESPLDVVRLASHDIPGAVAVMGSYVSDEQIAAMVGIATGLVFAFDDDQAGDTARAAMTKYCEKHSLSRYRNFRYPKNNRRLDGTTKYGKDVGDLDIERVYAGLRRASSFSSRRLSL